MTTNKRIYWAVNMLDIQPTDMILEIGCGTGIAMEQVAHKLTSGKITAIDQSQAMITQAAKRNKDFKASEKLKKGNFAIVRTVFKTLSPVPAFCIIAQPIR